MRLKCLTAEAVPTSVPFRVMSDDEPDGSILVSFAESTTMLTTAKFAATETANTARRMAATKAIIFVFRCWDFASRCRLSPLASSSSVSRLTRLYSFSNSFLSMVPSPVCEHAGDEITASFVMWRADDSKSQASAPDTAR